jgi:formamidopyrimidine-DNA glycosylase
MPELPEVENLRLGLIKNILGEKILNVEVRKPKLIYGKGTRRINSEKKKKGFVTGLTGEKILDIERRAKNLVFKFTHGKILLVHLKMSGQFVYLPSHNASTRQAKKVIGGHPIEISESTLPNKHSHVIFELDKGTLYYNDTRMFGYLLYYPNKKEFEKVKNTYHLDKKTISKGRKDMIVMHALPRVNEIDIDVDDTKQAKYFEQAGYGVYMRMALLSLMAK